MRRGECQKPSLGLTTLVAAQEADLNFKIILRSCRGFGRLGERLSALQPGKGDSAPIFPVARFDGARPKVAYQNQSLLQQATKAILW